MPIAAAEKRAELRFEVLQLALSASPSNWPFSTVATPAES